MLSLGEGVIVSIEEMLKVLGVRTQSKESIELCYQMDIEAFNMMAPDDELKFKKERYQFECVYKNLMDELGYKSVGKEDKRILRAVVDSIDLEEDDKEYRDLYFTGLERTLLRYGRFDLVRFQRIQKSDHDGIAKDAYLYELRGDYDEAMSFYNLIGETDRYDMCQIKAKK